MRRDVGLNYGCAIADADPDDELYCWGSNFDYRTGANATTGTLGMPTRIGVGFLTGTAVTPP